jgi:hypothetical protein
MKKISALFITILFLLPGSGWAVEVEGVSLPDAVQMESRSLELKGAGVRTKFFFDIYVAALYLEQRSSSADEIINSKTSKRLTMNFLYDEVSKEKLTDGWEEGFKKNQPKEKMLALRGRLDRFNTFFETVHKDGRVGFDFLSNGNTNVRINGSKVGIISGADFQQALLAVWLGKKPADSGLKKSLLGK